MIERSQRHRLKSMTKRVEGVGAKTDSAFEPSSADVVRAEAGIEDLSGDCCQRNWVLGVSVHRTNPKPLLSALGHKRTWSAIALLHAACPLWCEEN